MDFIEEHSGEHWVSLSVSEFLSIGRIYADATLHKLVSFMLTSYLTQVKVYLCLYVHPSSSAKLPFPGSVIFFSCCC